MLNFLLARELVVVVDQSIVHFHFKAELAPLVRFKVEVVIEERLILRVVRHEHGLFFKVVGPVTGELILDRLGVFLLAAAHIL